MTPRFGARAETIARILVPHSREILEAIEQLKTEYDDGRLVKSLEDLILAGVLKNFVK